MSLPLNSWMFVGSLVDMIHCKTEFSLDSLKFIGFMNFVGFMDFIGFMYYIEFMDFIRVMGF